MADLWTAKSDTLLAQLEEKVTTQVALPVLSRAVATLISGNLPLGMRLENNSIVGTPYEVARKIEYLKVYLSFFIKLR